MTLTLLRNAKSSQVNEVAEILFYLGKIAERLCFIEAAAGTCGNISARADGLPVETFPEEGARIRAHHKLDKDFIGKEVIAKQKEEKPLRKLVCLELEGRAFPRHGYDIFINGSVAGKVTSGTF